MSVFHPKIHVFKFDKNAHIYIGSSNLTFGGLAKNTELNLKIETLINSDLSSKVLNEIRNFANEALSAEILNEKFIEEYQKKYSATVDFNLKVKNADIDNIPVRKWVYMNIILNNRNLDLYINGYLKVRKELTSLPKQNDDDFWINMYGGFEGYLSNIRYYSYVIDFNEIYSNIQKGPSSAGCIDTNEIPP